MTFAELTRQPLLIPDRTRAIRRLIDAQAVLWGLKLTIAWEVSGVPAILDLVRAGHGHAVLGSAAVRVSRESQAFIVRRIEQPRLLSKLCLAVSAHKPPSPLVRHARRMLGEPALRHAGSLHNTR